MLPRPLVIWVIPLRCITDSLGCPSVKEVEVDLYANLVLSIYDHRQFRDGFVSRLSLSER